MTDKAELILHPQRMRIIVLLAERPHTAQELGRALPDVAQATLYRHLGALAKGGLIAVVEERQAHSNIEKVYGLAEGGAKLTAADVAGASADDHLRYFTIFVGGLLQRFAGYLDGREQVDLAADGVSYNTGTLYLSDEELRDVQNGLRALIGPLIANQPRPDRRRRQFATVLMPADPPGDART
ncbi:MAG TPA: helix-turn-helix domain-containing protein [Herpetosiphonaceae bacterium]|nr:helix-turn-helix domain-containing protein [Herpetosiphonaceae bacterium]